VHIDPLSFDEVEKFIANVRTDYKPYFTVRFFTGLRTGEVHGLQWRYIDFERREILVRETYSHLGREYTKNDGSQREVRMSEPVYQALKAQYEASGTLSEYVFCTGVGTPIDPLNVNKRVWKPTLKLLGMKDRRFYQTRHTAATLWLASGEAPEWIARQMGHTSTEMLFKVYSRYVPNLTRQDGSAFERLLLQRMGGVTE
jgi:integrase